ncbi:putative porin, partial [Brevundimonas sp.]|uniref:putative porin n=1 Tax=Brevundimonas sp. TaxID=1871086 RepID=UPI002FCC9A9B
MQTPTAKAMTVEAKLATATQPVAQAATIEGIGRIDVASAEKIYLRMYAGTVSSMVRDGTDLIVVGPDGEVIRLAGFYEGPEPRQLLLMDNEGGLVMMETSRAITDGPMPVYSIGVLEPSPFEGLTHDGGGDAMAALAGGGVGAALAVIAGLGIGGAIYNLVNDDDKDPTLPELPDTTAPAAPGNLVFSADGSKLGGTAEAGSTITVRDPSGKVIGTGTTGTDGRFEVSLSPPLINTEKVTVTATDAAGNISGPSEATAPDLTPPAAAANLDVNDDGTVLTGTGEPSTTAKVYAPDGTLLGSAKVGTDGTFSVTLQPAQVDGETVKVTLTDASNNVSPDASTVAPDLTPTRAIDAPDLDIPEAVVGIDDTEIADGIQTVVTFGKGAEVGGKVVVTIDGGATFEHVLTAADIAAGQVIVVLPDNLAHGSYSASAVVLSASGESSMPSADFAFNVVPGGIVGPDGVVVSISTIAGDDIVNIAESQGSVTLTGSVARVGGFQPGGTVEIEANGTTYRGQIAADGTWSVAVRGSDLTGGTLTVKADITDNDGIAREGSGTRDYTLDLVPPSTQAPTLAISGADDGVVTGAELAAGLDAEVGLPQGASAGDTVVLTITVGGIQQEITRTLSASDISAGKITIALGSDFDDGNYVVTAQLRDPAGNPSPSASTGFEIDGVALDVGASIAGVSEVDASIAAVGQIAITDATANATVTLSGPTAAFTSRGEAISWQTAGNGDLIGVAGGRTVLTVSIAADGSYRVQLVDGIDHPAGSDNIVLPITVTVTDGGDTAIGAINVNVADGMPSVAAPMTLSPTQPGLLSGTLVTDMGLDGGYMETVTVDGLTFTYSPMSGSVVVSGTSSTVLSHSFEGQTLTVTTIRGETVEIDMSTGAYNVTVTGREAQPAGDNDPFASMGQPGGLLGLVDANVLDVIKLEKNQLFTASDLDNDLKTIELSYSALVGLGGGRFVYDTKLATELGINVVEVSYSLLLPANHTIRIEASNGGTLDNWKLNEFLGTLTMGGGLLAVDLASSFGIKATDAQGNLVQVSDFTLADVAIGGGGIGTSLPAQFVSGSDGGETLTGTAGLDSRIYGYGGDDTLVGGAGKDILRGGSGNDILLGGDGNDILIGGTGGDTMTGGAGVDIFRFEGGDQINAGSVPLDTILDFNNAGLTQQGDVLDLSDLLQGEGRVGKSAGNLGNYLHFENTADSTVIHISTTGGFAGGFSAANAGATDQRILLKGVDLTAGFDSDIAIINDLLASNKLLVDAKVSADPATHGDLQIGGTAVDGDGDRGSSSVTVDDDTIGSSASNNAPTVGAAAENTLGILGGNLLGYNLATQDLLVADADNNLARVTLEYAPVLAVNLSPLSFAYDQTLATALGYEVRVTHSEGVLGLIAPRAKIEIVSTSGDPLDNAEINAFLQTVHVVDLQGGLLSSSLLSVGLLNAMNLTAQDVWGESSSVTIGSFLDANLLNSIGGPQGGAGLLSLFGAVEWLGDNAGVGAIDDFSSAIRGYLSDGLDAGDVADFTARLQAFWGESLDATPLAGLADLIRNSLDGAAVSDFADSLQAYLAGGFTDGHIADFIARVQAHVDTALAGTPLDDWSQSARDYLSASAIGQFVSDVQAELTARFADKSGMLADFAAEVQGRLSALFDGSYLSDLVVHLRDHLDANTVSDFADALSTRLSNGFTAADIADFISDARAHIDASLAGSPLANLPDHVRQYLGGSAITGFAAQIQAYLQDHYGNTHLGLPPLRNNRQDRNNSWRIRARLGVVADLGEHTRAGVRLAPGNDN